MGYIGKQPETGRYGKLDQISAGFNGSTPTFNLTVDSEAVYPVNPQALIISLNGVIQQPGTDFTVSAATITFTTNPASGGRFFGVILGDSLDVGTPSDGSITVAKMAANSVDSDQYVDGSIDSVHIANDQIDSQHYAAASIDNEHLADNAVDSAELAAGAVDIAHLSASGSAGSGTFLRGDNQWAAAGGAFTLIGGTTTEATHNATSSTQILASGTVSVPATTPMFLTVNSRKTGGAASQCRLQWQLNTTVDHERAIHSAGNQVESFIARAFVGPRATNYQTIIGTSEASNLPNNTTTWNSGSIAMPIATLTAVDLFANALNASQTQACNYLHVYTHAVS